MRFPSLLILALLFSTANCSAPADQFQVIGGNPVELLRVEVIATYPHDTTSFTQGLLLHDDVLYESTGLYGQSKLRRVVPETGEVTGETVVAAIYFAEGLALVDERLIQLTWREKKALIYDRATLTQSGELDYTGEGWGLTYDGTYLLMSDGSSTITWRDPASFAAVRQKTVKLEDKPVTRLNELEYAEEMLYANEWQTNNIHKIDPKTGAVRGVINAAGLLTADEAKNADVLNGIAYDGKTKTFLITGKRWPKIFRVKFVPVTPEVPVKKP